VLSALVICAAITAVVAGVTGASSASGFSMGATMLGSVITFGGLAVLGHMAGPGAGGVRAGLGVTIAVAAAIADWRGVKIFVLAFAVWALAGISFAAGDPLLGAVVGVAFGLGRALPVLMVAPGFSSDGQGARLLDGMAREPRMWLGLRRLDALGLSLCAVFLSGASATAAVLPQARHPAAITLLVTASSPGQAPALGRLRDSR
jgi:hypothetical protein